MSTGPRSVGTRRVADAGRERRRYGRRGRCRHSRQQRPRLRRGVPGRRRGAGGSRVHRRTPARGLWGAGPLRPGRRVRPLGPRGRADRRVRRTANGRPGGSRSRANPRLRVAGADRGTGPAGRHLARDSTPPRRSSRRLPRPRSHTVTGGDPRAPARRRRGASVAARLCVARKGVGPGRSGRRRRAPRTGRRDRGAHAAGRGRLSASVQRRECVGGGLLRSRPSRGGRVGSRTGAWCSRRASSTRPGADAKTERRGCCSPGFTIGWRCPRISPRRSCSPVAKRTFGR